MTATDPFDFLDFWTWTTSSTALPVAEIVQWQGAVRDADSFDGRVDSTPAFSGTTRPTADFTGAV